MLGKRRKSKMKIRIRKRIKRKSKSKIRMAKCGDEDPTLNPNLALNPLPNLNLSLL
jgi:hypothetical protein